MNNKFLLKVSCLLVSLTATNYGITKQNAPDLETGTKNFLIKEIQKQHKTVDPDTINIKILNLEAAKAKSCNNNINYYFPIYSNINQKATIIAECKQANNSWKLYIPVSIKFYANAVSVKKSLPKLHVINKEDLVHKKINVLQLKDPYYADSNEVVGLMLKTSIKQNTVLTADLLEKG